MELLSKDEIEKMITEAIGNNDFDKDLKEAEQGDPIKQVAIANCYADGRGVSQDYKKAIEWIRKAAEQGYNPAQYVLGNYYAEGKGVEKDINIAILWYQRAADQGHIRAKYLMDDVYGTEEHKIKVFEQLSNEAENGNAMAQFNLAFCYINGKGTRQDNGKAIDWLKKSAEQGFILAKDLLSKLNKNG